MRPIFVLLLAAVLLAPAAHAQPDDATAAMRQKLALARQYFDLTHTRRHIEETYSREVKLAWNFCQDAGCRSRLNQVIDESVRKAEPEYEKAILRLLADRLTAGELQAAISFAQSPEGRAIHAALDNMSGDIAQMGHNFAHRVSEDVRRSFCSSPAGADACARIAAEWSKPSQK